MKNEVSSLNYLRPLWPPALPVKSSSNIHAELDRCARLLASMEASAKLDELEHLWLDLIGSLERIWNKCQSHFGTSPKWNGWKGKYEALRKNDPLLSYLIHARGAHEHTVAEVVAHKPGSVQLSAGPTGYAMIRKLFFGPNGISFEGDGTLKAVFTPANVMAIPVMNRGRSYPSPSHHLGIAVLDANVLNIAHKGFAFYSQLAAEAEAFFSVR